MKSAIENTAHRTAVCHNKKVSGFTLIELVIAIAIVGILTAIAVPSYQDSVRKSKRKAAASCSIELSQFAERFYTTNTGANALSYTGLTTPVLQCRNDLVADYTITFTASTATTYTISAVPQGGQASDVCGTLSLTNTGTKSQTAGDVDKCWNR